MIEQQKYIPPKYRFLHELALRGESPKNAIAAFCIQCCGWEIEEVFVCTDPGCPLYPYRPTSEISKKTDQNTQNSRKTKKNDQLLLNLD